MKAAITTSGYFARHSGKQRVGGGQAIKLINGSHRTLWSAVMSRRGPIPRPDAQPQA